MATEATALHLTDVRLPAREPFDFRASLGFIGSFPAMAGQQGTAQAALTLAVREAGATLGVRLTAAPGAPGASGASGLDARLAAEQPITAEAVAAVTDRIDFYLGLSDDLAGFYRLARQDEPFARVVERLHGYHQVKFPSPFELLCWAILCQRVPMPVARQMKRALVEAVGNRIDVGGERLWAFPDVDQLARFEEAELVALIGNQRKASYLHRSVRLWAELDEHFLRTGPYQEVRERLLKLPGIGEWSASFLLIRGLGRMERIVLDKEMGRAVQRVYGRPVDEAEFQRLAEHYGAWQGYWGHYLRVGG
ncbi:DNA-3-methyladenine glycosylase family protein [Kitasatospora sp. NPDC101155]|uniref:DNA-3-methyladenine glycosylase family protein n=1 Tax=Kitasatospora sp. NPDC101155 TaxID=3364097 RepID=UPI003817B237